MRGGSLFANCGGFLSRVHRGGRGVVFIRVCPRHDWPGTYLHGATYRGGYSGAKP
jgi:hypothetical protein